MAGSRDRLAIEGWIRDEWLPQAIGGSFEKRKLVLSPGGVFEFDAVNEKDEIVGSIYTGNYLTSGGKPGGGKKQKILADLYFLLLVDANRKLILLTDHSFVEYFSTQQDLGRVPKEIEITHVELPAEMRADLDSAIEVASREVRPS